MPTPDVLFVCTGNICRSPLAAAVLRGMAAPSRVSVDSAGTRAARGVAMTPEAARLSVGLGADPGEVEHHRGQLLTDELLENRHLVLAMTRDHRRQILERKPALLRTVFTAREFARLVASLSDEELRASAAEEKSTTERFRRMVAATAAARGAVRAARPEDDDVIDPYRRSSATYARAVSELMPGVEATARLIRLADEEA